MHKFTFGDRVSISFNAMPDEERERLEDAMSVGKITGRVQKSRVDQSNHQTQSESGTILDLIIKPGTKENSDGLYYTVGVDQPNSPRQRPRVIQEEKLTSL